MRCNALLATLMLIAGPLLNGCATTGAAPLAEPPLAGRLFTDHRPSQVDTLVLVVHGDAWDAQPLDHFGFAERAAEAVHDGAAVALIRPGYGEPAGPATAGTRDRGNGDGYTAETVKQLADTVRAYRQRYSRAETVLVGDGGGAALVANLAGTHPALVDSMLLVSCPCTLPEWRASMARQRPDAGFRQPVNSLDPLQTVGGIATTTRTAILVGEDDKITPPRFSRTYAEALALRGIAVDFRRLPGRGHGLLDDPETIQALARLTAPVARTVARQ
jgi:pimeloyl-ACP methyl ester carboxylesterase